MKGVTSSSPSQIARNIDRARGQIKDGDTVAIYLPNHKNDEAGRAFAAEGVAEARRKGFVKGPIEIWFSNKTKIEFPWKE